ncbi:MAG: hypothetical protein GY928_05900 [Colwellia sp.]|nr:hypothetical protein [Colwellia sp.]
MEKEDKTEISAFTLKLATLFLFLMSVALFAVQSFFASGVSLLSLTIYFELVILEQIKKSNLIAYLLMSIFIFSLLANSILSIYSLVTLLLIIPALIAMQQKL